MRFFILDFYNMKRRAHVPPRFNPWILLDEIIGCFGRKFFHEQTSWLPKNTTHLWALEKIWQMKSPRAQFNLNNFLLRHLPTCLIPNLCDHWLLSLSSQFCLQALRCCVQRCFVFSFSSKFPHFPPNATLFPFIKNNKNKLKYRTARNC